MTSTHRFRNLFTYIQSKQENICQEQREILNKLLGSSLAEFAQQLSEYHTESGPLVCCFQTLASLTDSNESPPTALTLATSNTKTNSKRKQSTCSHHVMSPMYCVWESQTQNVWSYTTTGCLVSVLAVPGTVMLL